MLQARSICDYNNYIVELYYCIKKQKADSCFS